MIGQYSDEQFKAMYNNAILKGGYSTGIAWIKYGKYTYNYYTQHNDKSWTNFDCKTKYI